MTLLQREDRRFDGKRAFSQVAKQVGFGPRPSGSAAIGQLQEYIQNELTSYGCKVETDSLRRARLWGGCRWRTSLAKIPGDKAGDHHARHALRHQTDAKVCRSR